MSITVVDFGCYGLQINKAEDVELGILAKQITSALSDIGFVYLINTGIQNSEVLSVMDISRKFFALPQAVKEQFSRSFDSKHLNHGWVAIGSERLNTSRPGDLKEAFNVEALSLEIKWPPNSLVNEFQTTLEGFFRHCEQLSLRILNIIALGLGLNASDFVSQHKLMSTNKNMTTLRSLYYPPIDKSTVKKGQTRCGEHSDYGTITLLFQDSSGGLEVMHRTGEYIYSPPIPGAVLVNIGDLMQRWTSDLLISTKHRVMLPSDDKNIIRQSVAFFVHPDDDTVITSCDGSNKYPPITAKNYVLERFNDTYN
ncbi:2-oxoglutarate-dependent dioxygenase htyE-like [Protopterus annectens]|uniref:2-oxoglutarate-dependent dioxygenase htyE-like n=1 Tax=Protopterus annectens TaxID=7888 RepID=UPI001CFBB4CA|nr:2-oxoglutarate-dependent dioxygenase htyE-like [Protopterus annectens]